MKVNSSWLKPDQWEFVQAKVPIACVDVLPVRLDPIDSATVTSIGLILRETPREGRRWCLIGGRLLRGESLGEAVQRQIRETLGEKVTVGIPSHQQPTYVVQYFTDPKPGGCVDPRQHAIGLTYCLPLKGDIHPQGEALEFAWFDTNSLPSPDRFGFDQHRVVAACLHNLNTKVGQVVEEIP